MTVAVDLAPGLERAFAFRPREDVRIERVEGRIPAYLAGSYYLNGPGLFRRGELPYRHWLDGDGMVCHLRFENGVAELTNRFVRSAKFTAEEAAGGPLFRTFGTAFDGDQLKYGIGLESPVNVSVYPFAGRLLAFGEQGLPYELDPHTLETRGLYDFGRRLNPIAPFSAHPAVDATTGEMINFGVSFASRRPCLNLYRFTADGDMAFRRRLPLDAPRSVHDFSLSRSYAVFYLSPYLMDMERLAQPHGTLMEALSWRPELGSKLLLASRQDGAAVAEIHLPRPAYCLHLIHSFEDGDTVTVDVLELERPIYDQYRIPELFPEVRHAHPRRLRIDPGTGRLLGEETLPYDRLCDFPTVDPRQQAAAYQHFWVLGISASDRPGRKFFDELVRLSWQDPDDVVRWRPSPGSYLGGEPVFLPDPKRTGEGCVLCQLFDAERDRGAFLLFDAHRLLDGPLATLWLDSPVHLGFHSTWHPD